MNNPLYETDFYTWTQEQAAVLKAGNFSALDIENLLEEIESMGRSEKNALKSHLRVLLMHLLKWQYQPEKNVLGSSWKNTLTTQRLEVSDVLSENPGLKPSTSEVMDKAYRLAKNDAASETNLAVEIFPEVCPWTFGQIIDPEFFP